MQTKSVKTEKPRLRRYTPCKLEVVAVKERKEKGNSANKNPKSLQQ